MKDLFSKLGEIAQTAAGASLPGVQRNASQPNAGTSIGDMFGSLKNSVPGGVGGLLGAGALGGILAALVSDGGVGKTVRKVGENALVVGGAAVAAGFAWKLYQKWTTQSTEAASVTTEAAPVESRPVLAGHDPAALLVLEAMVYSARADGHIDETERNAVYSAMAHLFPGTDIAVNIDTLMNRPLDPEGLARRVTSPDQARDLYRLSRMVVIADHSMERAYLDSLAAALGIAKPEQTALDQEVAALQAG